MSFSIDALNPPQKEAVLATEGPVLILAGAGSGKTRTLTCRIAHLLEQGIKPWHILAITFTNKAADEMKSRVTDSAPEGDKVWVATFHSTCLRILRLDADRLGYEKDFGIYDTDDSRVLLRRIIKDLDYDPKQYREREIQRQISSWKNKMITVEKQEALSGGNYRDERVSRIYREYQKRLMQVNAMDFDDLLLNAVKLFEENPDVLENWRDRFRYIMVDEYQDTNRAQFRFVELLAKEHRNLCVVGDDDQSIYRFCGADVRNILDFESVFPETRVFRLEQNYRSTQNILKAANGVISHNEKRKEKKLWTAGEDGEKVYFREYEDAREEARGIVKEIVSEQDRFPFGSCAILYRTNAQSRILEETFVSVGVPYRLIGGVNFYERREIKDCLSYLRLIANPRDDVSLRRIVNVPRRGLGDTSLEKLSAFAAEREMSLLEAMDEADAAPELKKAASSKMQAFAQLIGSLRMEALSLSVEALIERVLRQSGYYDALEEEDPIEAEARRENLQELINKAADFGGEIGLEPLLRFLSETSLIADVDELEDEDRKVVLMTLHAAKGLEFPKVYMAGMEQQVFPGDKALYSENSEDVEEERRLCYVGITRAKKKLVLTAAGRRMVNGSFQTHSISQFVEEIPSEVLKKDRGGFMLSHSQAHSRPDRDGFSQGSWQDFGDSFGFAAKPWRGSAAGTSGTPQSKPAAQGRSASPARVAADASLKAFFDRAAAAKPAAAAAPLKEFSPGDRVVSRRFGAGTVVSTEPTRQDTAVTVDFDKYGRKVLLAAFAGFTREE